MSAGIAIPESFLQTLPAQFLDYYRGRFRSQRMIYGHWSLGPYSRAVGQYHRQIVVDRPVELDESIERYWEARNRRVGGAISTLWHDIEEYKKKAAVHIFSNAPYEEDLADHTRNRESGAIALALMCGWKARFNDLGQSAPLPVQIRSLLMLVTEACLQTQTPAEHFMTHSEAADNLDFPTVDHADAPHPPYGFRSDTHEVWDLEVWIDAATLAVFPPKLASRPGWMRMGDWLRQTALREISKLTVSEWKR